MGASISFKCLIANCMILLLPQVVSIAAQSTISVALEASFSSAPYLVELLETAADENATSYFPILDRVAEGAFETCKTDEDVYHKFLRILKDDGHMTNAAVLSSFELAVSLRTAAPRVEAHYQYYHTAIEPSLENEAGFSCPTWVLFDGKQYCSPSLESASGKVSLKRQTVTLPFDRVYGNVSAPTSILYADLTSPTFGMFHSTLITTARNGRSNYRLRHRTPMGRSLSPLIVSGYGVELALKRTDYIVIDDREEDVQETKPVAVVDMDSEDHDIADLKPLSTSELASLDLRAASFVMQSETPMQSLLKLSQDFPKYSSMLTAHNATPEFLVEHVHNRGQLVPAGMNVLWINGVQISEAQIDAFSILNLLRKERAIISEIEELGITSHQAIDLLSHNEIAMVKANDEAPRFVWDDAEEGGEVIIWLNDIEKDKRYEAWPASLNALLQRTFPGQLPSIRRNLFNLIVPVDLTKPEDVRLVTDQLRSFVQRKLPMRFGVVPLLNSTVARDHAKAVYHINDNYGLSTALMYLESSYGAKKTAVASEEIFDAVLHNSKLRRNKVRATWSEVMEGSDVSRKVDNTEKWIERLGVNTQIPPFLINGVLFPRSENWLPLMSEQVNIDLNNVQRAIFEEKVDTKSWLPGFFLVNAARRRNTLIIPESAAALRMLDMKSIHTQHSEVLRRIPRLLADSSAPKSDWLHMMVFADLSMTSGQQLLLSARMFQKQNPGTELVIVQNVAYPEGLFELYAYMKDRDFEPIDDIQIFEGLLDDGRIVMRAKEIRDTLKDEVWQHTEDIKALVRACSLRPGENAIVINGRLIGSIPSSSILSYEDFEQLAAFERSRRIMPVYKAIEALGLDEKLTEPAAAADFSSRVAIATTPELPEGVQEAAPGLRLNSFNVWHSDHTAIKVGDLAAANIRITVTLDPASETAQRWVPMLSVLSELQGVHLSVYLNPVDRLQDLPVKRFYRYVLDAKPRFDSQGQLSVQSAHFSGIPQEALLNLGMDVPASWLVAPKRSLYDLDNIKLSTINGDVEAIYELENILIEGHSREMPSEAPPRGAQLVLGTEREPHAADTIIMANLGYFQFKANPGHYNIDLQQGRSSQIFEIDSLGTKGISSLDTDGANAVTLMDFQGTTLFPRLSRKVGQEQADVLESEANATLNTVSQGFEYARSMLGLGKKSEAVSATKNADINIFSVASGHLYERMLNIMMVSVMKHTKHTVKFWFIEQFLSPSFKDSIPLMAAEYGFKYEMVTFKWPHWLRQQKEKQREIWGYKILFLDVLFPLSLDKVIFVDADQIVRTDMMELVNIDLKGAPYGFTPMCDSRTEMEGFRFWKQGYWKGFLDGLPYHISALYVVDLKKFREIAAGDRLRQQYHQLSADPNSLSNLDQDLPNHMQAMLPIFSLPQDWLWCETWCSDESLKTAKTIDLCNNPLTKEPKLDRARRQVPEWTVYDEEIAAALKRRRRTTVGESVVTQNTKSRRFEEPVESRKVDEL